MINMIETEFTPYAVCWVYSKGANKRIAVSEKEGSTIYLYDIGKKEPSKKLTLHTKPVHLLQFNHVYETVVSVDEGGMIEYWDASSLSLPSSSLLRFQFKSQTDLYHFPKVVFSLFIFFFLPSLLTASLH